jgi:hypothetical protein
MNTPFTCPTIDKIIIELTKHKVITKSFGKDTYSYSISAARMDKILAKLEELRELHKQLRAKGEYYRDMCPNPEVLPKEST